MFFGLNIPLRWVLLIAIALFVGGAVFWARQEAGTSTAADTDDALARYRDAPRPRRDTGPRRGVPRPGVYTYRQIGSERVGLGPASVPRDLPDRAVYVVVRTDGGYREELDLSGEHIEGARLRVAGNGSARIVSRRTKVVAIRLGRDDRRALRPPALHVPSEPEVGRIWGDRYRAGDLPVSFRSEVLRAASVTVGDRRVPTVVIRTTTVTGGAHPGTRIDTRWWSTDLALAMRWTIEMRISGIASLRTESDLTLERIVPVV